MGPKKADNANKHRRVSQHAVVATEEIEDQRCTGKFASDIELCCRDSSLGYPVNIVVHIRGHSPLTSLILPPASHVVQQPGPSVPSSVVGAEEHALPTLPRLSRSRAPSISHSGILPVGDNDNKSVIIQGHDVTKPSLSYGKSFNVVRDSEFFRPKLLADSVGTEEEPIEQITALYMRAWQLDQRFIEILKKTLPLQEQLHTLNFCFVGLNEQTIYNFAELCQLIKNLKTVSLDGNPLAADHFHILLEKHELRIAHLSLRFCKITDKSAERLAHALGNIFVQNCKLLTLALTSNQVGDNGAKSFAKALRYNRTLISLNLSSNFITDKGACALALVLRKIVLTEEELLKRRYMLSEHYDDAHFEEMRNNASSPSLSTISTKSKSGRDLRNDTKRPEAAKRRKSISMKTTDKRNRPDSADESRPPSANKVDPKKGKTESHVNRSLSVINRRSSNMEQSKSHAGSRKKKLATGSMSSSKKNISSVKEQDEDTGEEFFHVPVQDVEHENPILELHDVESHDGEVILKGNFVLLNLNLSRNYLTSTSVKEFLISIQHQMGLIHSNDSGRSSSMNSAALEFSGMSRLELQGMNDVSTQSSVYRSLENLLAQKNPLARIQQFREREAKELLELQQQQLMQAAQPVIVEKARTSSALRSMSQRPTSRLKD